MEPFWLTRADVDGFHEVHLQTLVGLAGVHNSGVIESALMRPQNRYHYERGSLFDCAAAYIFGLARNHGYRDGNKRTAYSAGLTFLALNGWILTADPNESIDFMLRVAAGTMTEPVMAEWLKQHSRPG